MSERYSRAFSAGENLYITGCPIMISAAVLLKDNKTDRVLVQAKLRNVYNYPAPVVSTTIGIMPLNEAGVPLGDEVTYTYKDLSVERNEEFGQKTAVYLPDSLTRMFKIRVKRIVFADGRAGTIKGESFFYPIPPQKPLSSFIQSPECIEQYVYENGSKCNKSPMEYKDLWVCSCGGINRKDDEKCISCSALKSSVFNNDIELLKQHLNDRRNKEGMSKDTVFDFEDEILENKPVRIEPETTQNKTKHARRSRKTKKIVVLSSASLLLIAAAVVLLVCIVIPSNKYDSAQEYLDEGNFEMAESIFGSLDYKDSKELANQISSIIKAQKQIDSSEEGGALNTISVLLEGNEVSDRIRAKADILIIEIVKRAIDVGGNSSVYKDAKAKFQNTIESCEDKSFKEKVSSYEEYLRIMEMGAIDSKERIKEVEDHLSKITVEIKGVKRLREVLDEYKAYVGRYKGKYYISMGRPNANLMFNEAEVFIGVATTSKEEPWAAVVKVDNRDSFHFEFPKKSVEYVKDDRQKMGLLTTVTHMKGRITLKNKNTVSFDSDTYVGFDCVRVSS